MKPKKLVQYFNNYAYVTEGQIKFKETYYGYKNALSDWHSLQETVEPGLLSKYFKWVTDETIYDDASKYPFQKIAIPKKTDENWEFSYTTDLDLLDGNYLSDNQFKIAVDGIFWQYQSTGIARVWKNILTFWVEQGVRRSSDCF
jgi:hypothetical protein